MPEVQQTDESRRWFAGRAGRLAVGASRKPSWKAKLEGWPLGEVGGWPEGTAGGSAKGAKPMLAQRLNRRVGHGASRWLAQRFNRRIDQRRKPMLEQPVGLDDSIEGASRREVGRLGWKIDQRRKLERGRKGGAGGCSKPMRVGG